MTGRAIRMFLAAQSGHASLRAMALGLSVFAAGLMAPWRIEPRIELRAEAQTLDIGAVALASPGPQMQPRVQSEVAAALSAMPDGELSLTYARIHAAFRQFLGHDDLSVARALIDYATLAETELRRRDLARPPGTDSASGMHLAYELVL